jgi:hypothetical protein
MGQKKGSLSAEFGRVVSTVPGFEVMARGAKREAGLKQGI